MDVGLAFGDSKFCDFGRFYGGPKAQQSIVVRSRMFGRLFGLPHYTYFAGPWWEGCIGLNSRVAEPFYMKHGDQQINHSKKDCNQQLYFYNSVARYGINFALVNCGTTRFNQRKFLTYASDEWDHLQFWSLATWEKLIREHHPRMSVHAVNKFARAFQVTYSINRMSDKILNDKLFRYGLLLNETMNQRSVVRNLKLPNYLFNEVDESSGNYCWLDREQRTPPSVALTGFIKFCGSFCDCSCGLGYHVCGLDVLFVTACVAWVTVFVDWMCCL